MPADIKAFSLWFLLELKLQVTTIKITVLAYTHQKKPNKKAQPRYPKATHYALTSMKVYAMGHPPALVPSFPGGQPAWDMSYFLPAKSSHPSFGIRIWRGRGGKRENDAPLRSSLTWERNTMWHAPVSGKWFQAMLLRGSHSSQRRKWLHRKEKKVGGARITFVNTSNWKLDLETEPLLCMLAL